MAKVDYIARETGHNLLRNISLTLASMVTVAVSLSLVGSALLLRQGVQNATARWEGGIEFIVFINPEAEPVQEQAVREALESSPAVDEWHYVTKDEAYEEFVELFRNTPEMIDAVSPEILPPSFRVVPDNPDADAIRALGQQFENRPGVYRVVFAFEAVQTLQQLSRLMSFAILIVAAVLLFAAGLLILNTIRMAMFARRREIEVMKLVGATNWFIRIPFMLEGLIQGVVGASIAVGSVVVLNNFFESWLQNTESFQVLQGFVVSTSELVGTSVFIFVVGMLVGAIGSGIAVSRFLDV
ncbi:MAG: permease-like cell division protein FtsX [Acidimicrobiales bacterium]|nr:permease-like cell division protein FtsX [Acidimicrobiales bacterium]